MEFVTIVQLPPQHEDRGIVENFVRDMKKYRTDGEKFYDKWTNTYCSYDETLVTSLQYVLASMLRCKKIDHSPIIAWRSKTLDRKTRIMFGHKMLSMYNEIMVKNN